MLVKPTLYQFQEGWGTQAMSLWLKKNGQGPVSVPGMWWGWWLWWLASALRRASCHQGRQAEATHCGVWLWLFSGHYKALKYTNYFAFFFFLHFWVMILQDETMCFCPVVWECTGELNGAKLQWRTVKGGRSHRAISFGQFLGSRFWSMLSPGSHPCGSQQSRSPHGA